MCTCQNVFFERLIYFLGIVSLLPTSGFYVLLLHLANVSLVSSLYLLVF